MNLYLCQTDRLSVRMLRLSKVHDEVIGWNESIDTPQNSNLKVSDTPEKFFFRVWVVGVAYN